jgi:Domain of unknown function (DUF5668)
MRRFHDIPPGRRAAGRVLIGLCVIAAGAALLMSNLGLLHLEVSYRLWPLILVALGLAKLVEQGALRGGGHWLILLGLFLLAGFLEREDLIERWWPLAVVWIGLLISARALLAPRPKAPVCEDQTERTP